MIRRYINKNYRAKLILCFIICAVIPVLLIGITSYTTAINIAEDKLLESVSLSATQVARSVNSRMTQVENMAESIHFNLFTLNNTPKEPKSSYMNQFSTTRNNITALMDAFRIFHISIFTEPGTLISEEGINFLSYDDMPSYHITPDQLKNLGIAPRWIFSQDVSLPYLVTKSQSNPSLISCYRTDMASDGTFHYIFGIHLTTQELSDILLSSYTDHEINAYIVDSHNTIVASNNLSQIGIMAPTLSDTSHTLSNTISNNWTLVTEIPNYYIKKNTQVLVNIIVLTLIIVVILIIISILIISFGLTKKINVLSSAMENIQYRSDHYTSKIPLESICGNKNGDEIERLSYNFNRMLSALDHSFHEILDLSIREERLNYSLLQSQINPHFLYNILGSINTLLSLNETERANQMLHDLSKFYRGMLRKSENLITISQELETAELYLKMEALCKNDSFTWNIRLDEGVEHFLICKFTLQPILENSIQHGLSNRGSKMQIEIRIAYLEDMIRITISDDGTGIPAQRLEEIRHDLEEKTVRYDKHFGISNINARISSSLLEHGSINITSNEGQGTVVCILIPQIYEEEGDF